MHELYAVDDSNERFTCIQFACNDHWFTLSEAVEHAVKNQYKVKDEPITRTPFMGFTQNFGEHSNVVRKARPRKNAKGNGRSENRFFSRD